jgi:glycosyltransferase involved in cell wall biosynthesis
MMRLAVVTTHPIQYQVPWLQRLAARDGIELQVYFAMLPDSAEQGREFGVAFAWDLPLLDGYRYTVLENRARNPSLTAFKGCDTPQIYREIRRGRFDAVIVNGWVAKTCLQALLACRWSGTPCIVRGEANGLRPRAFWKRWLHRVLLAQYSAYLSIGSNNRDYYRASGVAAERIFDTPYCVDNDRFGMAANAWRRDPGHDQLCARFGLSPEKPTFLFSGKFVDKKRPGDIVEATRQLFEAGTTDFQVMMVGDGPLADELRAKSEGLPIHFTGFLNQSEITAAYAVANCLLLPSDHGETWGLVVNEAMACGLPALVSKQVGCAIDLVEPGLTGDTFACGDVGALSALMGHYAGEPALLETMGAEARRRVFADYNFDRVVDGVVAASRFVKGRSD